MTSKFSNLREMRQRRAQSDDLQADDLPAETGTRPTEALPAAAPEVVPAPRKLGRPAGKRSNPDYQQVTVLLRSDTYLGVRKQLLGDKRDVSELINEVLADWLSRQS